MKKGMLHTILSLALVLMLALTPATSLAAAQYGELTAALAAEAWTSGREINTKLFLSLEELTGAGLEDEETQQVMSIVGQVLDIAAINVSAVALEDGVRIGASAELSGQQIIDGALEITPEVISAQTNVLPGKRLIVKVDDLMSMAGVTMPTEEQINALLEQVMGYAMDAAVRYGSVVAEWAQGIEVQQGAGTAATDSCDAIAVTDTVVLTGPQVKALLVNLFDAAMEDQVLISALNSLGLTDNHGNAYDMAHELALSKQAVEEDTVFDPARLTIAIGYGDAEKTAVVSAMVRLTVDETPGALLVAMQTKTMEDGTQVVTVNELFNDGNSDLMRYDIATAISTPAEGTTATTVSGTMVMGDDYQTVSMDIDAEGETVIAADSESMTMKENMLMNTVNGSEAVTMAMALGLTANTVDTGDDFESKCVYEIGMDANIEGESVSMKMSMGAEVKSSAYVPSTEPMTDIDVLTLDDAGMESLATEAQSGLMQVAFTALSLLPQEVMTLVMGQ